MRTAEWINLLFFSFFIALAWLRPLPRWRRARVSAIGAAGIGLILAAQFVQRLLPPLPASVIRDWLPAPLVPMIYWQAGRFFQKPNEQLQTKLERFDHKVLGAVLRSPTSFRGDTWIATYFELTYLLCYLLVPLGIGVLYLMQMGRYADEYWTIVLPAAYLCYGMLPFIQTLPPRMLPTERDFGMGPCKIRVLNLWILRHASIQVNTFPSAHVAATMGASLALLRLVPLAGVVFLWVSMSIAVGAVVGRYHYAADALIGAGLAAAVFLIMTFCYTI